MAADAQFRLGLHERARRARRRTTSAARPAARWLLVDQRDLRTARLARRLRRLGGPRQRRLVVRRRPAHLQAAGARPRFRRSPVAWQHRPGADPALPAGRADGCVGGGPRRVRGRRHRICRGSQRAGSRRCGPGARQLPRRDQDEHRPHASAASGRASEPRRSLRDGGARPGHPGQSRDRRPARQRRGRARRLHRPLRGDLRQSSALPPLGHRTGRRPTRAGHCDPRRPPRRGCESRGPPRRRYRAAHTARSRPRRRSSRSWPHCTAPRRHPTMRPTSS